MRDMRDLATTRFPCPRFIALSGLVPLAASVMLLSTSAMPARASEGVLEISRTCALQTGCFAGDTPGYPVTISAPGSYRLTSNLTRAIQVGGTQNEHFIEITAADVHVDLGGFRINCFTILGTCNGPGGGIVASGAQANGTSVTNGTIDGVGRTAIELRARARVVNVQALRSGLYGISVSTGSIVTGSVAADNSGQGISANVGCLISDNTVLDNGANGINTGQGTTVTGNAAYNNDGIGIRAGAGSTVSNNTSYANTGHGILAVDGGMVVGNTVYLNSDYGLRVIGSAYRANSVYGNLTGTVDGGENRGDNYCAGTGVVSAFCP